MKELVTQDGTRIWFDDAPPQADQSGDYVCKCHEIMGNDFWFLPMGSCLLSDNGCDRKNEFFK